MNKQSFMFYIVNAVTWYFVDFDMLYRCNSCAKQRGRQRGAERPDTRAASAFFIFKPSVNLRILQFGASFSSKINRHRA